MIVDISGLLKIAEDSTAAGPDRLRAYELAGNITETGRRRADAQKDAERTARLEIFKTIVSPGIIAAAISVATLFITQSFTASQTQVANENQIALEKQKFQFDVLKSALSEDKEPYDRAETLQFLMDVGIITGLTKEKIEEWAKKGVPAVSSVAPTGTGAVRSTARVPVDSAVVESLRKQATDAGTARWMEVAINEIGVTEAPGSDSSADVMRYATEAGLAYSNDEIAWSGLFVAFVLRSTGLPITDTPLINRSWLEWGKQSEQPVFGALVVTHRGTIGSGNTQVGFYVGEQGEDLLVLGGNVNNAVAIGPVAKERLIQFRVPTEFQVP